MPASSTTASSAATARFSDASSCPLPIDADAITADFQRRRADGDLPEGRRAGRAAHRRHLTVSPTIRPRQPAARRRAASPPGLRRSPAACGAADAQRRRRRRPPTPARRDSRASAPRRPAARRSAPRLHRVAARTVPAVANISSHAGRPRGRTRRSPTIRSSGTSSATWTSSADRSRAIQRSLGSGVDRQRPTATSSPTTTSSRRRRVAAAPTSRVALADKREMRGAGRRRRSSHRPGAAEDQRARPADHAVGRFEQAEGRRVGAGDRQPVPAEPDRHARHRLGARPRRTSASPATRTSSRPTRPSTRATRAARWSTARGELVGINTAIFSQSGGYQGIGFAVPSNLARKVMDDLVRYGEVRRGYLGYFETIPLTPEHRDGARRRAHPRHRRQPDGSHRARRTSAGLRPGDVILAFNDRHD